MRFLATVIDLPASMYTVQDAPREVRRKVVRILAICLAIFTYEIYLTVLRALKRTAAMPCQVVNQIYHLADVIITPTLPRVLAI